MNPPDDRYGSPPGQPQWGQAPQAGSSGRAPAGPASGPWLPTYAPAIPQARPGTMTLWPQPVSGIFESSFETLRRNFRASFGASILPMLGTLPLVVALVIGAVLVGDGAGDGVGHVDLSGDEVLAIVIGLVLFFLLAMALSAVVTGGLVHVFAQGVLGRRAATGTALHIGLRRAGAVLGAMAIPGAGVMAAYAVIIGVSLAVGAGTSTGAGVAVFVVLALTLGPAAVFAVTRSMFAAHVAVLERKGPLAALRRSWALTQGRFWRTLGIMLLVAIAASTVSGACSLPANIVVAPLQAWAEGGDSDAGAPAGALVLVLAVSLAGAAISFVIGAMLQAFSIYASTALYLDACIRDEDLAVALFDVTGGATQQPGTPIVLRRGELPFPVAGGTTTR